MAVIILTVVGNTAPDRAITLTRDDGDEIVNLTDASAQLILANERTGAVVTSNLAVTTPAAGIVTYSPIAADYPVAGRYVCDVKITYATGKVERFFNQVLIVARAQNNP